MLSGGRWFDSPWSACRSDLNPKTAPDVLVGTLHRSHRHQCANVCMNYCKWLWTKGVCSNVNVTFVCPTYKCVVLRSTTEPHKREKKFAYLKQMKWGATRWQNSLLFKNTLSAIQFGTLVRAKCRVCRQKIKCCAITRNHLQLLCDCFLFSTGCLDRSLSSSLHRGVKSPLSDIDTFKVNRPRAAANVPLSNLIAGASAAPFADKKKQKLQHVLILFGVFCQL